MIRVYLSIFAYFRIPLVNLKECEQHKIKAIKDFTEVCLLPFFRKRTL